MFTTEQLSALEEAYASGTLSVRHGDKQVTYASMEALWSAIIRLRKALTPASRRYIGGVAGYKKNG